ncbi:MAG TPA: 50S ribosomal protein L18 [Candidatus Paceibacterota bacterium]|nr:50S ribosomal protein L18 [Verrucomicrobiota bacterium]HOX01726.1 50S ribosomal protein L18 [Verrucomicrobiota bacterium]HRZ44177.1 50S ribosomal protein L18 [Candidatus Paceibacterota bacterium]HRZ92735.1 50S ribosomal protein L18 [Candidatus Paceibacterota bacterium]
MRIEDKRRLLKLRRHRIRRKVQGTAQRPRMAVRFTNQNIYVQFIDDAAGVTLASASTRRGKAAAETQRWTANVKGAKALGALAAEAAKSQGISEVVFDRSGAPYHGKVRALAEAAREAGLKF